MRGLMRAVSAEWLKLRGTLAPWLCLLAPLLIALFGALIAWSGPMLRHATSADAAWRTLVNTELVMWAGFMLPLFATLQTALLAQFEHGNRQWKYLLALPLPRATWFAAKLAVAVALVAVACGVTGLAIAASGGVLEWLLPGLGLGGWPPWAWIAARLGWIALAGLALTTLQLVFAMRWKSFVVPLTIGIGATIAALFLPRDAGFLAWFPWSMPMAVAGGNRLAAVVSVVLFVGLGITAGAYFARAELARD